MDGTESLVHSAKNSFYCSQRMPGTKHVSEKIIMKLCDADPRCTGYDYKGGRNYGTLCTQVAYPGSSKKCCGYKLCKKTEGMYVYRIIFLLLLDLSYF